MKKEYKTPLALTIMLDSLATLCQGSIIKNGDGVVVHLPSLDDDDDDDEIEDDDDVEAD